MADDLERRLESFSKALQNEFPSNSSQYRKRLGLVRKYGPYTPEEIDELICLSQKRLNGDNHFSEEKIRRVASFLLILDVNENWLKRTFSDQVDFFDPHAGIDRTTGSKVIGNSIDYGYLWRDQFTPNFRKSLEELEKFVNYGESQRVLHALNGRGNEAMFMAGRWSNTQVYSLDACAYNMREALDILEDESDGGAVYDNFHLLMADARKSQQGIPLDDHSVDRVFLLGLALASLVPNEPYEIMKEALRILSRKRGILIFDEYKIDKPTQRALQSNDLKKLFEGKFASFLYPLHIYGFE
jgi:hypothetical protein